MTESEQTAELVRSILAGNTEAFAVLVDRNRRLVFSLAAQHLANPSEVEDVAQETFIRAYRNLHKLRQPGRFTQWLYGIALNVAREHARRRDRNVPLDVIPEPAALEHREDDRSERLLKLVADLPGRYRLPLTLRYAGKMKYADIARELEITENLARNRVYRARLILRSAMNRR